MTRRDTADGSADSGGITAAAARAGDVHWERPGGDSVAACSGRETRAPLTTDRLQVTCGRCRGTRAWIRSAGSEPEPEGTGTAGVTPPAGPAVPVDLPLA